MHLWCVAFGAAFPRDEEAARETEERQTVEEMDAICLLVLKGMVVEVFVMQTYVLVKADRSEFARFGADEFRRTKDRHNSTQMDCGGGRPETKKSRPLFLACTLDEVAHT